MQRYGDFRDDVAGVFAHDHDPIGHEHRLFNIMRHHQNRFGGNFLVEPEFHQLAAQSFG
jgi:hypothetical protein